MKKVIIKFHNRERTEDYHKFRKGRASVKKIFISVLCIALILVAFTACIKKDSKEEISESSEITEVSIEEFEKETKNKNGLTAKEAENLCYTVLGDKAEENGFPISYRCMGGILVGDKAYYVMNITWLVNESHWSYIGNAFVSVDGREIYDGVALDGTYEMANLRWKK